MPAPDKYSKMLKALTPEELESLVFQSGSVANAAEYLGVKKSRLDFILHKHRHAIHRISNDRAYGDITHEAYKVEPLKIENVKLKKQLTEYEKKAESDQSVIDGQLFLIKRYEDRIDTLEKVMWKVDKYKSSNNVLDQEVKRLKKLNTEMLSGAYPPTTVKKMLKSERIEFKLRVQELERLLHERDLELEHCKALVVEYKNKWRKAYKEELIPCTN